MKDINAAGYYPNIEDVPFRNICPRCKGTLITNELTTFCEDCETFYDPEEDL